MKYLSLLSVFLLFSCGNKEDILLPKSNVTIVKDVEDHSPIYIFFRKNGKDTLAAVNRKNEIISTNWIFNIDKRLPLLLVLPEVMKLQEKKRNEVVHKNEAAQNYYSYADSIGKNLAFIPFTDVYYKLEKPKVGKLVFFDKKNQIWIDNVAVIREELVSYLNKQSNNSATKILFCYDKDLLFGSYVQDKIFIKILKINSNSKEEFIY
jgi:hypothetical protein